MPVDAAGGQPGAERAGTSTGLRLSREGWMDNKRLSIPDLVLASVPRADEIDALLTTIAELRNRLSHARCVLCGNQLGDMESALTADEDLAHRACIIDDATEGL
ncbi:MAG TPA: hypothetical protein VE686_06105 [Beijerinckiaceae bacterium]|jgi:hypothetical protein|nr:hypothetical protein [Beijerinckiaceae bacterium]